MEVQSDVQPLEPLPPVAASPPPGANQRSECEEGHGDTGASADSHSEDTPASQRDEMKVVQLSVGRRKTPATQVATVHRRLSHQRRAARECLHLIKRNFAMILA
ncbi:unnamed protein product [Arctogadus glacialis]